MLPSPLIGKYMGKITNFDSFGAVFPKFCPMKVKFGTGERTWGNVSLLLGEKKLFLDY